MLFNIISGLNSTTPSDDESDNTPATSRASSPMEIRKRGRLSRGAKLNQFQNNKDKFMTIAAKASRAQQQQDKSNKKSLIKREISSASSKYGYQNDVPAAHEDPEDSSDMYEDSGSDPEDPPPIRNLKLLSNPEYWSPMDTARFLAQTSDCQHLAHLVLLTNSSLHWQSPTNGQNYRFRYFIRTINNQFWMYFTGAPWRVWTNKVLTRSMKFWHLVTLLSYLKCLKRMKLLNNLNHISDAWGGYWWSGFHAPHLSYSSGSLAVEDKSFDPVVSAHRVSSVGTHHTVLTSTLSKIVA